MHIDRFINSFFAYFYIFLSKSISIFLKNRERSMRNFLDTTKLASWWILSMLKYYVMVGKKSSRF